MSRRQTVTPLHKVSGLQTPELLGCLGWVQIFFVWMARAYFI